MYTNSWDPNNGQILISTDQGQTFTPSSLPFKVGGNMPGRGIGEVRQQYNDIYVLDRLNYPFVKRLAVDPNSNNILFFGARSGHGLWKSTDYGQTWTQVTSLPNTGEYLNPCVQSVLTMFAGTYIPDPTDTTGYNSDPIGVAFVTFDSTSGASGAATPRIFVGVATVGSDNLFVSDDAGSTCKHQSSLTDSSKSTALLVRVRNWWNQLFLDASQGCAFTS